MKKSEGRYREDYSRLRGRYGLQRETHFGSDFLIQNPLIPGKRVIQNDGLLSHTCGLLWGAGAYHFGLLGFAGGSWDRMKQLPCVQEKPQNEGLLLPNWPTYA